MDRSQGRMMLVLSVLLVAVAGLLYWQGAETTLADPDATSLVWRVTGPSAKIDVDALRSIRLERGEGVLSLERSPAGEAPDRPWNVRAPFDAVADAGQVREVLDAFRALDRGIPVEVPPERAAEFGLAEPPEVRVHVIADDGTEATVDIGAAAQVAYRTYVRAADGSVAAVNGDPNRALQAPSEAFRDRRVFRLDPGEVRSVVIAGPDGVLTVRGQSLDWFVEGFGRADPDKVDDLVAGLVDLKFDVVESMAGPSTLQDRVYEVTVTLEGGSSQTLVTGMSGERRAESGIPCAAGDGRVGLIDAGLLRQLGRGPTDVAYRTALALRMDRTDRVAVTGPRGTRTFQRNGPEWTTDGVDAGVAWDTVAALTRIPLEFRRDPPPAPEPVEFTVELTEGERVWRVLIGPPLGDGSRSLMDPAAGSPIRVPEHAFTDALAALP